MARGETRRAAGAQTKQHPHTGGGLISSARVRRWAGALCQRSETCGHPTHIRCKAAAQPPAALLRGPQQHTLKKNLS